MASISLTGLAGEIELLDVSRSESVREVRKRLAKTLGWTLKQIQLLCGNQKLPDELDVVDAVQNVDLGNAVNECGSTIVITVANVAPDYEKHLVDYAPCLRRAMSKGKGRVEMPPTQQAFACCGPVQFPRPTGININMMPFIIGDAGSIPQEYRQYFPLLERCGGAWLVDSSRSREHGKIGYLTIQEGWVKKDESQRRPGLHIETPGLVQLGGGRGTVETFWGKGSMLLDAFEGGIYMASTVAESCKIWNAQICDPADVVGHLGDIEHFRDFLDAGSSMSANNLYWITDTTPHESLPLKEDTYRQYFRFVTSSVSVWYEKHSTKNPFGIKPDHNVTQIISEDKFSISECMSCNPTWVGWRCWYCGTTVGTAADS